MPLSSILRFFNVQLYARFAVVAGFFVHWTDSYSSHADQADLKYGAKFALIMFSVLADLGKNSIKANIQALRIPKNIRKKERERAIARNEYYAFEAERVSESVLRWFHHIQRWFSSEQTEAEEVDRGDRLLRGTKTLLLVYRISVIVVMVVSTILMNSLPSGVYTHNLYASAVSAISTALFFSDDFLVIVLLAVAQFLEVLEDGMNISLFITVVYWVTAGVLVFMVGVVGFDVYIMSRLRKAIRDEKDAEMRMLLEAVPRRGNPLDLSPLLAMFKGNTLPRDRIGIGTFVEGDGESRHVFWRNLSNEGAGHYLCWKCGIDARAAHVAEEQV